MSILFQVDGADKCDLKVKPAELEKLNSERALKLVISEESVAKRLSPGISRTEFELYPGCRAILHIFTKRKPKIQQEIKTLEM